MEAEDEPNEHKLIDVPPVIFFAIVILGGSIVPASCSKNDIVLSESSKLYVKQCRIESIFVLKFYTIV